MEVRALFGRFIWRGVNIDDVTIHPFGGFEDQSHTLFNIQTALITAVECLIRVLSDINPIGSNIWIV